MNSKLENARLAARVKMAADYDAVAEDKRKASDVAADLAQTRLEMQATVNDLVKMFTSDTVKDNIKKKAYERTCPVAWSKQLIAGIQARDPQALKIAAGLGVAVITLIALLKRR